MGLYEEPERPVNAVDYIKKYIGAPAGVDIDAVKVENDEMKSKIKELEKTIEDLNKNLKHARESREI